MNILHSDVSVLTSALMQLFNQQSMKDGFLLAQAILSDENMTVTQSDIV